MADADAGADRVRTVRQGWGRLAIGLAQGLALYLLFRALEDKRWPATQPALLAALGLVWAYAPLIVLSELGRVRRLTLIVWTASATLLLAAMAAHDIVREPLERYADDPRAIPRFSVWLFAAAAVFIGHGLVVAADLDRRRIAAFATYFDVAWTRGVQLALSVGFTGAFWLILFLGSALFGLINLDFFERLIREEWFAIPATFLVFAAAVHLTDVRAALVRGIRTVVLTLLAWLTPLLAVIAIGFLAALPFTGLEPLWETRSAAAILLGASGALIVLLNTAYQDGLAAPPRALRWAGLATAVVILPLTLIAAYAIGLRVGQYGWTPDRVVASAFAIAAGAHAIGYAVAAVRSRRGPWLKGLERTNIVSAVVVLALIVALFTPVADPARLSVSDQLGRLGRGATSADRFDYDFLRFDSARYGRETLSHLAKDGAGKDAATVKRLAAAAVVRKERDREARAPEGFTIEDRRRNITVYPSGATLPPDFLVRDPAGEAAYTVPCLMVKDQRCDAFVIDVNGDGASEVLVDGSGETSVFSKGPDGWGVVGYLQRSGCAGALEALKAGKARPTPSPWPDIQAGPVLLPFRARLQDCPASDSGSSIAKR
jgi:hypothetical protein